MGLSLTGQGASRFGVSPVRQLSGLWRRRRAISPPASSKNLCGLKICTKARFFKGVLCRRRAHASVPDYRT